MKVAMKSINANGKEEPVVHKCRGEVKNGKFIPAQGTERDEFFNEFIDHLVQGMTQHDALDDCLTRPFFAPTDDYEEADRQFIAHYRRQLELTDVLKRIPKLKQTLRARIIREASTELLDDYTLVCGIEHRSKRQASADDKELLNKLCIKYGI